MQDVELHFAPEGGNSHDNQLHFGPTQQVPEGGNSHHEHGHVVPAGGEPVECFRELALGLVLSLQDPTGQRSGRVVTDLSA